MFVAQKMAVAANPIVSNAIKQLNLSKLINKLKWITETMC